MISWLYAFSFGHYDKDHTLEWSPIVTCQLLYLLIPIPFVSCLDDDNRILTSHGLLYSPFLENQLLQQRTKATSPNINQNHVVLVSYKVHYRQNVFSVNLPSTILYLLLTSEKVFCITWHFHVNIYCLSSVCLMPKNVLKDYYSLVPCLAEITDSSF